MKREYFALLFIILSVALFTGSILLFGEETVMNNLGRFIIIWLLIAFYAGQYSMKLPKRF